MKRIRLIEATPASLEDKPFNWADSLFQISKFAAAGNAIDLSQMEKDIRLIKNLKDKKPGDILELEDSDWENLCQKLRKAQWLVADERIVDMCHAVFDAKEEV